MAAKIQDHFAPLIAKAKGLAVKGLLGRDAAFALVFFAVISMLTGGTIALARVVDPALAAFLVGFGLTLILVLGAVLAGRAPKP